MVEGGPGFGERSAVPCSRLMGNLRDGVETIAFLVGRRGMRSGFTFSGDCLAGSDEESDGVEVVLAPPVTIWMVLVWVGFSVGVDPPPPPLQPASAVRLHVAIAPVGLSNVRRSIHTMVST